jgi:hypothetical protein
MPAIIDSSPSCVVDVGGAKPADDSADFIVQAPYEECASIGTFMPGSTYGEDGVGAAGAYMALVWIGIAVTVAVLIYWAYWEHKRLTTWAVRRRAGLINLADD